MSYIWWYGLYKNDIWLQWLPMNKLEACYEKTDRDECMNAHIKRNIRDEYLPICYELDSMKSW